MARICVFCGSRNGNDDRFRSSAEQIGTELGQAGHSLVYGGGRVGLMGTVAEAALTAGAQVTGVITEQLVDREVAHRGLTALEIVPTMHARKERMAELSDGVIMLPGGFGTLDETFEILTWNQLGLVTMPTVCLNVAGYFDSLFAFVSGAVKAGFVNDHDGHLLQPAATAVEAVRLAAAGRTERTSSSPAL